MEAITRAARLGRTLGESPRRQNAFWHFFDTGGAFDILVQLWIITMSCVRILPPYGVPGAGRAAEDGDGLLGRLRGDARLHRQLRLHLSWLDRQLPPAPPFPYTLGRKVFHPATGSPWLHTPSQEQPPLPPSSKIPALLLFKATVHSLYNHRNVILTAHVFHRISNCSYMLSIVFCSGRIL